MVGVECSCLDHPKVSTGFSDYVKIDPIVMHAYIQTRCIKLKDSNQKHKTKRFD